MATEQRIARMLATVLATWFGCGYWPWGPGTLASACALGIAALLDWPGWSFAALGTATLPLSLWASGVEANSSGRKDPGHVVIDEVAGQWITLAAVPSLDWKSGLAAFALFRLLDIFKPPPARQFEALPGGLGIMADDVMAGVYGAVLLAALNWFNLV